MHYRPLYRLLFLFLFLSTGSAAVTAGTLRIWDFKYTDPQTRTAMLRVDHLFLEKYPDIEIEHTGFFDQEYIPTLRTALLAGTGPDILWLHPGTEFSEFLSYLEPLDTYLAGTDLRFRGKSLKACLGENRLVRALPLTVQGIGWYYNKEIFRRAGLDAETPPESLEAFLYACSVLKEAGETPIATGNNRPLTTEFIRRTLIAGFFTEEEIRDFYTVGRGIGTVRFREIIAFCRELKDLGYFDSQGLFLPYFNFAVDSFSSGEAAMIPGLLSDIAHWKTFTDILGADKVGYFSNLHIPGMERPGVQLLQDAGVMVCMNSASDQKEDAFLYMAHLFSPESRKILTEDLGLLSPLKEASLPLETYPVLKDIQSAMAFCASDPELFVPSLYVTDMQYRLDDLLINTGEISVDEYLIKLIKELKLY